MTRPLLLDLYCGAGGAAVGYHRAGFDVIGVDINPQPRYPFTFWCDDALNVLHTVRPGDFAAIHASPPCQRYSDMSNCRPGLAAAYPDLVEPTRKLLEASGLPWVMENVEGSALLSQPSLYSDLHGVTLCGHMFGLKLYRHRLFESNIPLTEPAHPRHITPGGSPGHWKPGEIISVCGHFAPMHIAQAAMGIDWMTSDELAESIPPSYTAYIGEQLLQMIGAAPDVHERMARRAGQGQAVITAAEYRHAADLARELAEFLDRCNEDRSAPISFGYDLDFLTERLEEHAMQAGGCG